MYIISLEDNKIIIEYSGNVHSTDIHSVQKEIFELVALKNYRYILSDFTNCQKFTYQAKDAIRSAEMCADVKSRAPHVTHYIVTNDNILKAFLHSFSKIIVNSVPLIIVSSREEVEKLIRRDESSFVK